MTLHYGVVTPLPDGRFQASCQCEWMGPVRDAELTAEADARRHEHRARPNPLGTYA